MLIVFLKKIKVAELVVFIIFSSQKYSPNKQEN